MRLRAATLASALALAWMACACGGDRTAPVAAAPTSPREQPAPACPSGPQRGAPIPDAAPHHGVAQTWLGKLPAAADAEVLVGPEAIVELNRRFSTLPGAWRDPTDPTIGDPEPIGVSLRERLDYLAERVQSGAFVEGEPGEIAVAMRVTEGSTGVDHFRVVVTESQLFCVPLRGGLFKVPIDREFDRNACASLHPGEVVRVLRRGSDGKWLHVHAGHTVGWLHDATLSPRLSREDLDRFTSRDKVVPLRDGVRTVGGFELRLGTSLPLTGRTDDTLEVLVPSADGAVADQIPADADVNAGYPPLTRQALFDLALSEQGSPYGWGGRAGERDCSRFLRDLFSTFGLQLGRHSGVQAQLGTHNVDVSGWTDDDKRTAIDTWSERGVLLLYMPGHIMLYLGEDGGHRFAVSSISEYLEPCPGGADTVYRVDRVAVTTLELGRGTDRTAFLERLTRLVVFGNFSGS